MTQILKSLRFHLTVQPRKRPICIYLCGGMNDIPKPHSRNTGGFHLGGTLACVMFAYLHDAETDFVPHVVADIDMSEQHFEEICREVYELDKLQVACVTKDAQFAIGISKNRADALRFAEQALEQKHDVHQINVLDRGSLLRLGGGNRPIQRMMNYEHYGIYMPMALKQMLQYYFEILR